MSHRINLWVTVGAMMIGSIWLSVLEGADPMRKAAKIDGKRWAILVAGSGGYINYRHQADVCHAYQILKKGGLKDENIIVFMADDVAFDEYNPRPGVLINKPNGPDVYQGVPKDYTGNATTAENFYAVLSGNRSATKGGSGKVVDSGPNDTIFIYYADHGAPGLIGMPVGDNIVAKDFVDALKKKHAAKGYKNMVIYLEACESGSMFEGLLPNDINIFATTASNAELSSYAEYCPPDDQNSEDTPPEESQYNACLGDVYSISWMEDSDKNDMSKETAEQQFISVRRRTGYGGVDEYSSPVMLYGDVGMGKHFLVTYIGSDPTNSISDDNYILSNISNGYSSSSSASKRRVNQRDAHLLHLRLKLQKAPDGSNEKIKAQKELDNEIAKREFEDNSVKLIGDILFGEERSTMVMANVRPAGQPLVDDWDCFKKFMKIYESHCGALSRYGKIYSRAFANMCNVGISEEQMFAAATQVCHKQRHAS